MLAEPSGRIISSQVAESLEINGLMNGKITSFTIDCTKFNAAMPTINATEMAIILYCLRNSVNRLKIIIIVFVRKLSN